MADVLAAFNATLNASVLVLLLVGRAAIARGERERHRLVMLSAVGLSALFLVSYGTRMVLSGTHRFPAVARWREVYLVLLASHSLLAALVTPAVLVLVALAWRQRFETHRRLARVVWPVWVYVSATGVLVYLMLYQLAPRLG